MSQKFDKITQLICRLLRFRLLRKPELYWNRFSKIMSIDNLRETKIFVSRFKKSSYVKNLSFLISTVQTLDLLLICMKYTDLDKEILESFFLHEPWVFYLISTAKWQNIAAGSKKIFRSGNIIR